MRADQTMAVRTGPQTQSRETRAVAPPREIPFDHVLRFALDGKPAQRNQKVVNVSIEGTWILTAISWSFVPAVAKLQTLVNGVRSLWGKADLTDAELKDSHVALIRKTVTRVMGRSSVEPAFNNAITYMLEMFLLSQLDSSLHTFGFFYSLVDTGSGRELQDDRVYSAAGLGRGDGERPFYTLPRPMVFAPRSTLRVEIEEVFDLDLAQGGELNMVMHGYKVLP